MDFKAERVSELNCGQCGAQLDPTQHKPLSQVDCPKCGSKIRVPALFGEFLLTEVMGAGAAGIVCKGFDQSLHRQVALKILKTTAEDAELVEQCTREARALAALNHPNVVQVHSIGEYRGQPFIVMELLDGGDVYRRMIGKPGDEIESLSVVIQTAEGLAAAHRAGLVHMDVKPGNILYDHQGQAKLIDFGVAQVARRSGDSVAGTPYYVAPEVIRGKPADFNADIYSLGSTLFHLLAGRPPFEASDATQLMRKKLKQDAPDLLELRDDVSPRTAEVVARMLARDPGERYTDYDELLSDLRDAREAAQLPAESRAIHELMSATSAPAPRPVERSPAERPARIETSKAAADSTADEGSGEKSSGMAPMIGIGVAAVLVIGVGVATLFIGGEDPEPRASAARTAVDPDDAPLPPGIVPVLQTEGRFARDSAWRALQPDTVVSSGGSTAQVLDDRSVLFSGDVGDTDTYTLTARTDANPIYAIGIEVMPHESLGDTGGPGRGDGNFFLSEVRVEAAPAATPDALAAIELTAPEASYAQNDFPIADTLDGDPKTAWAISPRYRRAHTATFRLATPLIHTDGSLVRVTLEHHPDFRRYIGRVRIWVSGDTQYAPDAPAVAIAPDPAPDPTPPTPEPKPDPKPEPPPPPPADPVVSLFDPAQNPALDLADEGVWHTLDVVQVTSFGGAKAERRPDDSLVITGKATPNDEYRIIARTTLRDITALRIEAMPDDALPGKGPGRLDADGKKGLFTVERVTVAATPQADPDAATPVEIAEATSILRVRQGFSPKFVLTDQPNGWANHPEDVGKADSLRLAFKQPMGASEQTTLVVTIRNRGPEALGRFRLSATTNADAKLADAVKRQQPRSSIGFVALTPTEVTSNRAAEFAIEPDGAVSVDSKLKTNHTYTVKLQTPPGPPITMLRFEALPTAGDSGPGLPTNGAFMVLELGLSAAPADQPTASRDIELTAAAADFHDRDFTAEQALDGNKGTGWAMVSRPGEPRVLTFRPKSPIDLPGGSVLTLTVQQRMSLGRFRVSATSMPNPAPLAPKPVDGEAVAAGDDGDKPMPKDGDDEPGEATALYFNLGTADFKDPNGNVWKKAGKFRAKNSGYEGNGKPEKLGADDQLTNSSITGLTEFKATVPDGLYTVTLIFGMSAEKINAGTRKFDVLIEERLVERGFDVVTEARAAGYKAVSQRVRVADGVLDVKLDGKGTMLSAISIVPVD